MTRHTVIYRKDLEAWQITTVGMLRDALAHLPDHFELMTNGLGNFAILEPGLTSDETHLTRWYIGYIDLATGEVTCQPGIRSPGDAPGHPDQDPFAGELICQTVTTSDWQSNLP